MQPFEYAVSRGFTAFEWFPDKKGDAGWEAADLNGIQRGEIRETAKTHGMRLSVHARWTQRPSLSMFLEDMALAEDLGAVVFNIHLDLEAGMESFLKTIKPLIQQASGAGMRLAIENTPHHSPEQFNELFVRLRSEDRQNNAGMCLDLGHANLCAATRNDYLKFIDRLDPMTPIVHLHFHENWGDSDSHLPLFTGPSRLGNAGIQGVIDRLRQRNYAGSIILEQWPNPPELLDQARFKLMQLLELPRQDAIQPRPDPIRGAGDFDSEIVEANRRSRSWREKLDFIHELLASEAAASTLTGDKLVSVAVYLRYLGAGQIPCEEDGRHFRPSHHARIALQIREVLSRQSGNQFIIRQILPCLPSTAPEYQRAEPLTRIRDIAHRNDIPAELKSEIKHSLQNKLHRCAGPEDLVTSRRLLDRITAPGTQYSADFVAQFKIFHEELEVFFNARSLVDQLEALAVNSDEAVQNAIRSFLVNKDKPGLQGRLNSFESLTRLRREFARMPQSELERETADIGLEDYAFGLLSETINLLDNGQTPDTVLFDLIPPILDNLVLSDIEKDECHALVSEFIAWRNEPGVSRDNLLRLKATVDRCRRLAETFSEKVLRLFQKPAGNLGRALGVSDRASDVFCEAEIRRHIVFQLSKTASIIARRLRDRLGLSAWDVLSGGNALGRVRVATNLDSLGHGFSENLIAVLDRAEGDEEIPEFISGIVLAHEIPHLSHLGVRARQAGIVFVVCEEASELSRLRAFEGQSVALTAQTDRVSWDNASSITPGTGAPHPVAKLAATRLESQMDCLPLDRVDPQSCGGKCCGAKILAELARRPGAGFHTPPSVVAPFGVMASALQAASDIETKYKKLLEKMPNLAHDDFVAGADKLRECIQGLPAPAQLIAQVLKSFQPGARFIVRSSANCEDMETLSGAGLYESVANVGPDELADAIRTVWASLWTPRAALSRRQAGIPHDQARMALLIQQLIVPDYSFVLHTTNPASQNPGEVYAEIAVGLGETLASAAAPGNPYRIVCDKHSEETAILAFANFSQAAVPASTGGLEQKLLNYSRIDLSVNPDNLRKLGNRLCSIALKVEAACQYPQDIEGAVVGEDIYLVQTRAQQGVEDAGNRNL